MELIVKFTLDASYESNTADNDQLLKELLRHDLDGVKAEIVEAKGFDQDERNTEPDTFIRKDEFGELHKAPTGVNPCDICKYGEYGIVDACSSCGNGRGYYKR